MSFLEDALGSERGRIVVRGRRSFAEIVMEGRDEVATEGFFDSVRSFFRRKEIQVEKEFHEEAADVDALDKGIQMAQSTIKSKQMVRPDAASITLGPYAKWMMLNGQFINNEMLSAELKSIDETLKVVQRTLIPASIKAMEVVRSQILEPMLNGAKLNNFQNFKTLDVPSDLDRLFAIKEQLYEGKVGMRAERQLGEWFLLKSQEAAHIYISATTSNNVKGRPDAGQFDVLTPDEVKQILVELKNIQDTAASILNQPIHPEQVRLQKAMNEWDELFDTEDASPEQRAVGEQVYREGYIADAQYKEADYAAKFALHNVRVVLRLCEMSIRRMK